MVIIPIDDTTRIVGTEECWQLEKLHTPGESAKDPEPRWVPKKYFARLCHALATACEAEIRTHPAVGINEALQAAERVSQKYAEMFKAST